MTLLLDAGGLIAIEEGDRRLLALVAGQRRIGRAPLTHAGVLAQVWRGGAGRQVGLARFVDGLDVRPFDDALARATGLLLGHSRSSDVVDAALVVLASDGDLVITSDVADLAALARHAGVHVDLVAV